MGSLLSLNRAWRAQVTFGTSVVGLNFFFYKLGQGNDGQERDYGGVEASAGGDAATVGR